MFGEREPHTRRVRPGTRQVADRSDEAEATRTGRQVAGFGSDAVVLAGPDEGEFVASLGGAAVEVPSDLFGEGLPDRGEVVDEVRFGRYDVDQGEPCAHDATLTGAAVPNFCE